MPIKVLPTDTRFTTSPFEGDPDCLCSRCGNQIREDEFALRAWPKNDRFEYRYCDACQERMGFQRIPYDEAEYDEPEPEQPSEDPKLGKCCACEREDTTVRNVVMLDLKSPEPGTGCWGCFQCGLPMAGAVAVLCDACIEERKPLRFACLGTPAENRRVPIENLTERFAHDMAKHPEELALRDLAHNA